MAKKKKGNDSEKIFNSLFKQLYRNGRKEDNKDTLCYNYFNKDG